MKEGIKKNMVYIIVVGLLLGFAVFGIYNNLARTSKEQKPSTEQTSSSSSEVAEIIPESTDEKNYRTAKLKLEYPYTEATEEQKAQVAQAFEEAVVYINQTQKVAEVKGTIENHLSMSQEGMNQTLAMALLVNGYTYQSSELEVTPANNDDVVQFLLVLKKEGEDNCYFIGNFNTTVRQIQLKAYIGGDIGGTFG
ncbi:hypothetical protein J5583_01180 [Streptococcus suis]|uniref:hypothetical protein n=1 Tax=Streptococcus suis TaxID=1307 RepID=UPI001ABEC4B2|nr:hypothetical protein [Streptococcus suis]MBO4108801.1 hypothetical protein [Streptococcus suis]